MALAGTGSRSCVGSFFTAAQASEQPPPCLKTDPCTPTPPEARPSCRRFARIRLPTSWPCRSRPSRGRDPRRWRLSRPALALAASSASATCLMVVAFASNDASQS
ncbi:hypothetical protein ACFX10_032231 [Malus domestica]